MNPNQKRRIPEVEGPQPDGTTWKRLTNGRMVLLHRRPEWDAQEMLDHRRYIYDATYTLSELEEMEAVEGPETSEHGFRRGMGDGWKIAIETASDLVDSGMSPKEALLAMGRDLARGKAGYLARGKLCPVRATAGVVWQGGQRAPHPTGPGGGWGRVAPGAHDAQPLRVTPTACQVGSCASDSHRWRPAELLGHVRANLYGYLPRMLASWFRSNQEVFFRSTREWSRRVRCVFLEGMEARWHPGSVVVKRHLWSSSPASVRDQRSVIARLRHQFADRWCSACRAFEPVKTAEGTDTSVVVRGARAGQALQLWRCS